MKRRFAFVWALGFIIGHEMDAMVQHEWRILPLLSSLTDDAGERWFVALHVPGFAAIFWGAFMAKAATQFRVQVGLSLFLVLHFALHFVSEVPGVSAFEGAASEGYIAGAAFFGALCTALAWRERRAEKSV